MLEFLLGIKIMMQFRLNFTHKYKCLGLEIWLRYTTLSGKRNAITCLLIKKNILYVK